MTAEIVHDDDVAGFEHGHEDLLDIGEEAKAVDRPIEDAGGGDPIAAQRGEKGKRLPTATRDLGHETLALQAASMGARHIRLRPSLVDEDKPVRGELSLVALPAATPPSNVGSVLFAGVQAFF